MNGNPPNLLFLYTDEQACATLAAYGNRQIQMPNLNRLAAQSTIFERAYVTQPVCTPSRSSLLTGLYPHSNGCTENNLRLPPEVPCLPESFRGEDMPPVISASGISETSCSPSTVLPSGSASKTTTTRISAPVAIVPNAPPTMRFSRATGTSRPTGNVSDAEKPPGCRSISASRPTLRMKPSVFCNPTGSTLSCCM